MDNESEENKWVGYWWLPEQKENKVYGTLHYKFPSVINLGLKELLHKGRAISLGKLNREKENIILGKASGKEITLFNCNMYSTGFLPSTFWYTVQAIIEGKHFAIPEDIIFKKWTIGLSEYFNDWFGLCERKIEFNKEERVGEPFVNIKYIKQSIDEFQFALDNISPSKHFLLKINPFFNLEANTAGSLTCIKNNTLIELEGKEHNGVNIEEFIEFINIFSPLFEFFSDNLLSPKEIYASNGNFKETGEFPTSIYLHYSNAYALKQVNRKYNLTDTILPYRNLRDSFQSIIDNYLKKRDYLGQLIYSIQFSNLVAKSENNFIQYDLIFFRFIAAIENYCHKFENDNHLKSTRFESKEFKTIRASIAEILTDHGVTEGERRSILNAFMNSIGLKGRLNRLNDYVKFNEVLILDNEKMHLFIDDLVDKRNQIAHGDNRETNISNNDLRWSTRILKIMACIIILKELEVSADMINTCIKNNVELSMAQKELVKYLKNRKDKGGA